MEDNVNRSLKSLHTAAIDARNGYKEAQKDAEGRGLSGLFAQMIALHSDNAEELRMALVQAGEQADGQGSFMSIVHEAIMNVRSLFGGLGKSVLPGLIDGKERNLHKYDEALVEPSLPDSARGLLSRQRARLAASVASMKMERDVSSASQPRA